MLEESLVELYTVWCEGQRLRADLSADELILEEYITSPQAKWLAAFIKTWLAANI